jgi:PAS domain-containing protein
VPAERHAQADELLQRCKADEEVRNIEGLRTTKSGEVIPVLVNLSLLKDDDGAPVGIATLAKDIGDLKRAEERLRLHQDNLEKLVEERTQEAAAKERQLRLALENMPGGIFMLDKNLDFQVVNDRFLELFDLPDDAIRVGGSLSKPVRIRAERGDYGPGDVDDRVAKRLEGYADGEPSRIEETLPSGRVVEMSRTPVEGGGVVGIATEVVPENRTGR